MTEPRKILSLKGPRRKKQQRLIIRKGGKVPPPPKKPTKPRPTRIPADATNPSWQYLLTSPPFRDGLPMVRGYFEQALVDYPESLSRKQLRRCLKARAHQVDYLEATLRGDQRYNFDGTPAEEAPMDADAKSASLERMHRLLKKAGQHSDTHSA